ncbi:transcription factor LAF1-like isoform X1 [Typha angustifolia]|uniref:transcription factor LAF1-like isoform X1 n=1 Tax=Typha angustifolia TaxID=59011 RepID=UPI003C2BC709
MVRKTCEKPKMNYRKGLWSPDEDQRLRDYILQHGLSCWSAVPVKADLSILIGLQRNGKSCRLRWINYLMPGLKHGVFSGNEEEIIIKLQAKLGNKWSQIAMHLPGRTDNEVKNYWNSHLRKRIIKAEGSNHHSSAVSSLIIPKENNQISTSASIQTQESTAINSSQSIKPKILFSDWLSFDVIKYPRSASSESSSSDISEILKPEALHADMQCGEKFSAVCGDCNSIYNSELQAQYESIQIPGGEFFDLMSMGDAYSNFNSCDDVLFF